MVYLYLRFALYTLIDFVPLIQLCQTHHARQFFFRLSIKIAGVDQSIDHGVSICIQYSRFDRFYAYHFCSFKCFDVLVSEFFKKPYAYGTCAAVQIEHGLSAFQISVLCSFVIQFHHLLGIYLEE